MHLKLLEAYKKCPLQVNITPRKIHKFFRAEIDILLLLLYNMYSMFKTYEQRCWCLFKMLVPRP